MSGCLAHRAGALIPCMVMGNVADPVDLIDLARSMVCDEGSRLRSEAGGPPGYPHLYDIGPFGPRGVLRTRPSFPDYAVLAETVTLERWVPPPSSGPSPSPVATVAMTSRPGSWPSSALTNATTAVSSYPDQRALVARASGATRIAPRPAVVWSVASASPVARRSTGGAGSRPRAAAGAASVSCGVRAVGSYQRADFVR
jgi:hypothetical protein